MYYDFETNIEKVENGIDPAGIVVKEIKIRPKEIHYLGRDSIPRSVMINELGKEIAKYLLVDSKWEYDRMSDTGYTKVSSIFYVKDDMKEMDEKIRNQEKEITNLNKKISNLEHDKVKLLKDIIDLETEFMNLKLVYNETLYEGIAKDNDWKYLMKRSLKLFLLNVKIRFLSFLNYIHIF